MSTPRALCLGDLMVDVLAQLPTELAPGSDTPAPITVRGGGSAANTAAWLVAAGIATTFIGRVGDDVLGRMALNDLAAAGIDLHVSVDPVRPTGTCIVLVDIDGERTMVPSAGANAGLAHADLPVDLFAPGVLVHISGYAVFQDGARSAATGAATLATERGCALSVDAASAAPLRAFGAEAFLDWLPPALLFANLDEARVLTGSDDPDAAALALAGRCGEAIVKCGRRGAVWSDGTELLRVTPLTRSLVDSTGAGDAFAAGVLAARAGGASVEESLTAGDDLAARALSAVGGRPQGSR